MKVNVGCLWAACAVAFWGVGEAQGSEGEAARQFEEGFRLEEAGAWAEAAALYEAACAGGEVRACHNLGYVYARGRGVVRSVREAERLYWGACEAGLAEACHNLGVLYEEEGAARDVVVGWYRRGCEGGVQESCAGVTRMSDGR